MSKLSILLVFLLSCKSTWTLAPAFKSSFRQGKVLLALAAEEENRSYDNVNCFDPSNTQQFSRHRRQLFVYGTSFVSSSIINPQKAFSGTDTGTSLDALVDLPPLPTDYCRIFFCRHGQTENNRLRLVQGARVDVDINDLGRYQGRRTGLALSKATPPPSSIYYSPLARARKTAEAANREGKLVPSNGNKLKVLDALMEVDFGPAAEGQLVEEAKPGMAATYARWSMGNVDFRPSEGGDSARDVRKNEL